MEKILKANRTSGKMTLGQRIKSDYKRNKMVIFLAIPVVLYYIIFHYASMFGVVIAFQNYSPVKGILGSNWVGWQHFADFFNGYYAKRIISNTLILSFSQLLFSFPIPIIIALLFHEIHSKTFKSVVQTSLNLPHFISMVVICGMVLDFTSQNGLINDIIAFFGGERTSIMLDPKNFRTVYIASGIWQGAGWSSIIYISALASINQDLYEAATIDGAGRFKQFLHVTLPGIAPTIVTMLILNIGKLMSTSAEKIILLYNENTYETADTIASYVYRRGIINADYSFSTAVGLFNSIINVILVYTANFVSRKVTETSLW